MLEKKKQETVMLENGLIQLHFKAKKIRLV